MCIVPEAAALFTISVQDNDIGNIMPRPIYEQVVVLVGASSGMGRESAKRFAQAGAKVVLAARNEPALFDAADEIRAAGGVAHVVPTDVTYVEDLDKLVSETLATFGRIDTWVNLASTSVYAVVEETTNEEYEQVLRTNVLGTIAACKAVLPVMKQQGFGTIINFVSVLSYMSVPLMSAYVTSKHAVLGFTDSLRMELKGENRPIQLTIILPAGINTPFFNHARSKIGVQPKPTPPVYSPELAAWAVVQAAQTPKREVYIGGASNLFVLMQRFTPALLEQVLVTGNLGARVQKSKQPDDNQDNVYVPVAGSGRSEGDYSHLTMPGIYTRVLEFAPSWLPLVIPAVIFGVIALARNRNEHHR
jgi:short-subunit dehydrogenase